MLCSYGTKAQTYQTRSGNLASDSSVCGFRHPCQQVTLSVFSTLAECRLLEVSCMGGDFYEMPRVFSFKIVDVMERSNRMVDVEQIMTTINT